MDIFDFKNLLQEDTSIQSKEFVEVLESQRLANKDILTFEYSNLDSYILLHTAFIFIKGRLLKSKDNTKFTNADNIALANSGISLFKKAYYLIGNRYIEELDYVYITNLINSIQEYSKDFSSSIASREFYYRDTGDGNMEIEPYVFSGPNETTALKDANVTLDAFCKEITNNPRVNYGYKSRKALCSGSKLVTMVLPLKNIFGFINDFTNVCRGVSHKIELHMNPPSIYTQRTPQVDDGYFNIEHASMFLQEIIPNLKVESQLLQLQTSQQINFESQSCYKFTVPYTTYANQICHISTHPLTGIYIALQDITRENANSNSLVFDHMNVRKIYIKLNNRKYPLADIVTDFDTNDFLFHYNNFVLHKDQDSGIQITQREYKELYPIYYFDLTAQPEQLANINSSFTVEVVIELKTSAMFLMFVSPRYLRKADLSINESKIVVY